MSGVGSILVSPDALWVERVQFDTHAVVISRTDRQMLQTKNPTGTLYGRRENREIEITN